MDCSKSRAFMGPELDNELPVTSSAILQEHLANCAPCSNEWEALVLVNKGLEELKKNVEVPVRLEEQLMLAIDNQARQQKQKPLHSGRLKAFALASVMVVVCAIAISTKSNWFSSPVRAEDIVATTVHGAQGQKQNTCKLTESFSPENIHDASSVAGATISALNLPSYGLAGIDIYSDLNGKKFVRACYQSKRDKLCIDCYQAPSGQIRFASSNNITIAGKPVLCERLGDCNLLFVTKNNTDYIFASELKQEKLISLVSQVI